MHFRRQPVLHTSNCIRGITLNPEHSETVKNCLCVRQTGCLSKTSQFILHTHLVESPKESLGWLHGAVIHPQTAETTAGTEALPRRVAGGDKSAVKGDNWEELLIKISGRSVGNNKKKKTALLREP